MPTILNSLLHSIHNLPSDGYCSHRRVVLPCQGRREGRVLLEELLVDPHEAARLVGLHLVLDAGELVAELAVLTLVVVVVLHLPHRLEDARLLELTRENRAERQTLGFISKS